MSHKANHWLGKIDPKLLKGSDFKVLYFLCDCHNPANGCFPTQDYLRLRTGLENGTLNNCLNRMEANGIFRRIRRVDPKTRKKRSTLYILGCDEELFKKPTPETGDGTYSRKTAKPTPENGKSLLQPTGDKPVKKPVKEKGAARDEILKSVVDRIRTGMWFRCEGISDQAAWDAISEGLVTERECRDVRLL